MPAVTEPPEEKTEREEILWQALKEHIMLERQKKKEEQEAEVEEERLRKEREARDRQDAMTLGETREQIQIVNNQLETLRNEKQQLFLRLKKVLNEDENRKKQQQQKDSEMFALQNMVQQQQEAHLQIFLPPRTPQQHVMHKYLQGGPPMASGSNPPIKRGRSPSPNQSLWKGGQKHEESGKRGGEVSRAVLWNKPTYQNPAGTLYYPQPPQDSRGQSIVYPAYQANLNMPLRTNYHVEMAQQQQQQQHQSQQQPLSGQPPPSQQPIKSETKSNQNAQVYHINIDQPPQQTSQVSQQQQQQQQLAQQHHKAHTQNHQITLEKMSDRGYHLEMKHDDRKERVGQQQQQQHHHQPPAGHISADGIVYTSLRPGMPPQIHPSVMSMPPNQQVGPKTVGGGSITQGYPNRGPPQQQQIPLPGQAPPPQQPQMHYQRHRY